MGSLCLVCSFPSQLPLCRIGPTAKRESGKTDGLFFDLSYNEAFEVNSSPLLMFLRSGLPSFCFSAVVDNFSLWRFKVQMFSPCWRVLEGSDKGCMYNLQLIELLGLLFYLPPNLTCLLHLYLLLNARARLNSCAGTHAYITHACRYSWG